MISPNKKGRPEAPFVFRLQIKLAVVAVASRAGLQSEHHSKPVREGPELVAVAAAPVAVQIAEPALVEVQVHIVAVVEPEVLAVQQVLPVAARAAVQQVLAIAVQQQARERQRVQIAGPVLRERVQQKQAVQRPLESLRVPGNQRKQQKPSEQLR